MLDPLDDLPVHQTAQPVRRVVSTHPDAVERYTFFGWSPDADVVFGATVAVHPNRDVIDAALTVLRDGRQRSVYASGRCPTSRAALEIGPFRLDVVEPLRELGLVVDAPELGMSARLSFLAGAPPTPPTVQRAHERDVLVHDEAHFDQPGSWRGSLSVDGEEVVLDPARHRGHRERSWGVVPTAPGRLDGAPAHRLPQTFAYIAVLGSADGGGSTVVARAEEDAAGDQRFTAARTVPAEAEIEIEAVAGHARGRSHLTPAWRAGSRWLERATLDLHLPRDTRATVTAVEEAERVPLVVLAVLPLRGIGRFHPEWGHGTWHDELAVGTDELRPDAIDPTDVHHLAALHVVARTDAPDRAVGSVQLLALGPHHPSGLTDLTGPPSP